jgi:hypothetical protein
MGMQKSKGEALEDSEGDVSKEFLSKEQPSIISKEQPINLYEEQKKQAITKTMNPNSSSRSENTKAQLPPLPSIATQALNNVLINLREQEGLNKQLKYEQLLLELRHSTDSLMYHLGDNSETNEQRLTALSEECNNIMNALSKTMEHILLEPGKMKMWSEICRDTFNSKKRIEDLKLRFNSNRDNNICAFLKNILYYTFN